MYPPSHHAPPKFESNSHHDLQLIYHAPNQTSPNQSNNQIHENNRTLHNLYPTPTKTPLNLPLFPRVRNTVGAFAKESNHNRQRESSHNSPPTPEQNREKGKAAQVQPHYIPKLLEWNRKNKTVFSCELCNQKFDNPQVLGGHMSGHVRKSIPQVKFQIHSISSIFSYETQKNDLMEFNIVYLSFYFPFFYSFIKTNLVELH